MNFKTFADIPGAKYFLPGIAAVLFTLLLFCQAPLASPPDEPEGPSPRPAVSRNGDPYLALEESFRRALSVEQGKLDYLASRALRTESHAAELAGVFAGHQVMVANHAGMLAMPDVDLQSLSLAHKRQAVEMEHIENRLSSFSASIREFEKMKDETGEQVAFYSGQIKDLKAQPPAMPVNKDLLEPLESLMDVLEKKHEKLDLLIDHYRYWQERYLALLNDIKRLSTRFANAISEREMERILQQEASPLIRIAQGELAADLARFSGEIREIMSTRFWHKPDDVRWDAYAIFLITFLSFFLILQALLYLLARYLGIVKAKVLEQHYFYRYLLLQLIQRSVLIVGAIAFFYWYPVRPVYQLAPFFVMFPVIIRILILFLGVHWGLVFLRGIRRTIEDPLFLRLIPLVRMLFVAIFFFGTIYILVSRIYCVDCILLTSWRLLGQFALLVWMGYFLKVFYENAFASVLAQYAWFENARVVVVVTGLALVFAGILAELTGYGGIAVLWFLGLWRTVLAALWAFILFGFLKESDVSMYIEKSEDLSEDQFEEQPYPVRWLIVRIARLALVILLLFSLPLAWGADRTFLVDLFYAVNFGVSIGDFEFRAMGVVYALVVLLIIYTLSVLWKSVLRNRILYESDMEEGLKDSITRISAYGLWAVGIIVAMQMIGISGTSLAVVFGALGIGLGFGLQNIFKDFISGIILLFERPIQVGDVVEIEGMWGTVKEINVRATYVKTYDNADLIIPNADFVSRMVTNWSFRDPRIRRRIRVRVAYDSDIRLVKETLMNIAFKHPRVLRRPYPEVYLVELGESAMLFELRIWMHVDHFIPVETEVRDGITSQFRELGIRIAFPQQDIYIKEAPPSPAFREEAPPADEVDPLADPSTEGAK